MQEAGVTQGMAEEWADFYDWITEQNPANPSSSGRAVLLRWVSSLLSL